MSELVIIARIHTDFPEKFGIPRQSGLVPGARGTIIFEPEFRNPDAIRGIEEYSHLWLLWNFSKAKQKGFVPMVTPPRLGGKTKKGVFATRSPFRPNAIGLSSVRLEGVQMDEKYGPVLIVSGADLLDGTPIYDIKPYLPYTDCHSDATGSFGEEHKADQIQVLIPKELERKIQKEDLEVVRQVLMQDPRAAYNKKEDYIYGMAFRNYDIRFRVSGEILMVTDVVSQCEHFDKVK